MNDHDVTAFEKEPREFASALSEAYTTTTITRKESDTTKCNTKQDVQSLGSLAKGCLRFEVL